jgi:GTP pyrophosphokinase
MIFCKKWHDGQMRKSGEQYYSHPFTVADMVVEYIPTTDVLIGALLHDVVEDTPCTLDLIKEEFNARVAQIVERLTRVKTDKDGNKIKVSVDDLMGEMRRVDDQEALLIKEIDRLHNLYTIESMSEDKQQHTAGETMEHVIPNVAYAVDNLNLDNKLNLEDNLTNKDE